MCMQLVYRVFIRCIVRVRSHPVILDDCMTRPTTPTSRDTFLYSHVQSRTTYRKASEGQETPPDDDEPTDDQDEGDADE